jgi:hypothetical protein
VDRTARPDPSLDGFLRFEPKPVPMPMPRVIDLTHLSALFIAPQKRTWSRLRQ